MTQIDFYIHTENKLQTACVLSAKAVACGMRVMIFTSDREASAKLDGLLWSYSATGFVPHCAASDPLAATTPVIIDHAGENLLHDGLLLNLRSEWPPFFTRFARLIEIIGHDETDKQQGRERYRFYRDRGYEIRSHDLGK